VFAPDEVTVRGEKEESPQSIVTVGAKEFAKVTVVDANEAWKDTAVTLTGLENTGSLRVDIRTHSNN